MTTLLSCQNLVKTYGNTPALNGINLTLEAGKIVGLLGPNGSGKTTLIKLITGLLQPTGGEILIDGEKPGVHTKSVISYLPDRLYFDNNMRVSQVCEYFQDFYADFDPSRARHMMELLRIEPKAHIKSLSKGNQEKVQLILAMSRHAKLYCLDEPIAGVDPAARDYILSTILNNYDENATILISTHLISDVENILDDFIFIQNGHICQYGEVEDVRLNQHTSIDNLFREVFKC